MTRTAILAVLGLCFAAWAGQDAVVVRQQVVTLAPATRGVASGTEAITIPRVLNYQGRLLNSSGNPVRDSTYPVRFSLYSVPSGGSSFWSETQSVQTRTGLFSLLLGSVTPIESFPQAGACYLGMKVGADPEMTPRIRIASAAYSFLAASAAALEGKTTDSLDARYVNEGQGNAITTPMIRDSTISNADISPTAGISDTKLAGTGTLVTNLNADQLDGLHASALSGSINRVIRGIISFSGSTYEVSQTFSPSVNVNKSIVVLSSSVVKGPTSPGTWYYGRSGACLVALTSTSVTVAVDYLPDFGGLVYPMRVSYQIIEYQ